MATASEQSHILRALVLRAIELGADELEIEYEDGHEEVYAFRGGTGVRIASLRFGSEEATWLRKELRRIGKKGKRIKVSGAAYQLKVRVYDSFGEDAFRVKIREA